VLLLFVVAFVVFDEEDGLDFDFFPDLVFVLDFDLEDTDDDFGVVSIVGVLLLELLSSSLSIRKSFVCMCCCFVRSFWFDFN